MLRAGIRKFVESQKQLSRAVDSHLPRELWVDGNRDFVDVVVPRYLSPSLTVYDVGGGKHPLVSAEAKRNLALRVIGLDIDERELKRAPAGCYDEIVVADLSSYRGRGDADLVICQALLEHVKNTDGAIAAIGSLLKPGGVALLFVPSKNAPFARLNRALPEALKRALLFSIFPGSSEGHGFPAYYDRCTPGDMEAMAERHGLRVRDLNAYYQSTYFSFFFPLYVAWRAWTIFGKNVIGAQAAETFTVVLERPRAETAS